MTYAFEGQDAVISPQLVYYKDIIVDNIEKMIALAGGTERLWPHVKTHKMIEVVKMMMAQGIDRGGDVRRGESVEGGPCLSAGGTEYRAFSVSDGGLSADGVFCGFRLYEAG